MDVAVETEQMFLLPEFTYDLEKSNAQTFNVLDTAGSGIVDTVRLDFTSNHGSPSHTCIYRFRVHGREPDSVSMMAMWAASVTFLVLVSTFFILYLDLVLRLLTF